MIGVVVVIACMVGAQQCQKDIQALFSDPISSDHLKMLDAWGRLPSGNLELDLYAFGAPWECNRIQNTRFCSLNPVPGQLVVELDQNITNRLAPGPILSEPFPLGYWGMCLPDSCHSSNLLESFEALSDELPFVLRFKSGDSMLGDIINRPVVGCEQENGSWSGASVSVASILIAIVGIGSLSVLVLSILRRKKSERAVPLLEEPEIDVVEDSKAVSLFSSLSAWENFRSIFRIRSEDLNNPFAFFNGIRVLSLLWVIFGHTYIWMLQIPVENILDLANTFKDFSFMIILNAFFSVDSFFLLGGFLAAYLTFDHIEKRGKLTLAQILFSYLNRYIRLTPSLLVMLLVYTYLAPKMSSGPLWALESGSPQRCEAKMWQNLLYINDLFDVTQSCAIWTWYLANDMQFFILAPFFILSLHFLPFFGHLLMLGVLGASIASCMILTRIHHLDAFWVSALLNLLQGGSLDGSSLMGITKYIYFKPWARIQPYLIGIYMGYMLKKWDMSFFKSTTRTLIGYVFAGLIMFASVFGLRKAQLGYPLTQLENMMYIGLSRIGWSISLGYLVMEHILGNGFFIKKMLSLPFWIPLARLSYGAYLLHPIFIEWFYFSLNQPFNFSVISIFFTFGGVVAVSFCAAAALSVFIESPFRKLTKLVFSYKRKSQREPPEVVVHQKDPEVPASAG